MYYIHYLLFCQGSHHYTISIRIASRATPVSGRNAFTDCTVSGTAPCRNQGSRTREEQSSLCMTKSYRRLASHGCDATRRGAFVAKPKTASDCSSRVPASVFFMAGSRDGAVGDANHSCSETMHLSQQICYNPSI